jgi:hypothetical protein
MYKTITDPYTQITYPINSKKGNNVLKNYLNYSMKGGAAGDDGSCWQISVDPNTQRSYWWNTKTKETKWYNPSNNSDVPPVNLDEDWECVCNTENCNCTNASKEIHKECVKIFKKYTTALGELKVEKSKTKSIEQLVINLSNKISTLKK